MDKNKNINILPPLRKFRLRMISVNLGLLIILTYSTYVYFNLGEKTTENENALVFVGIVFFIWWATGFYLITYYIINDLNLKLLLDYDNRKISYRNRKKNLDFTRRDIKKYNIIIAKSSNIVSVYSGWGMIKIILNNGETIRITSYTIEIEKITSVLKLKYNPVYSKFPMN